MGTLIRIPAIPTNANIVGGNLTAVINGDTSGINKRLYGLETLAIVDTENIAISYTVPVGKGFTWHSGFGSSDADCEVVVEIDGVIFKRQRNHQTNPDMDLGVGAPFTLDAGQVLEVKTTNKSNLGSTSTIEVWIYGNEYTL
jgi:hypothetical protein